MIVHKSKMSKLSWNNSDCGRLFGRGRYLFFQPNCWDMKLIKTSPPRILTVDSLRNWLILPQKNIYFWRAERCVRSWKYWLMMKTLRKRGTDWSKKKVKMETWKYCWLVRRLIKRFKKYIFVIINIISQNITVLKSNYLNMRGDTGSAFWTDREQRS